MSKVYICLLTFLVLTGITFAQECGPGCPVCSGAGSAGGNLLSKGSFTFSGLTIPTADEERAVVNTRYGVLSWLDAGIGYAIRTEKVLWNVRIQPLKEQEDGWRPGIILGSGSVQTGGADQSLYTQLVKSWRVSDIVDLQLSAGVATLLPDFDEAFGQAGIVTSLRERYIIFANYDGESFHEGISWVAGDWLTVSFLMVETEFPAVSVVFRK